MRATNVPRTCEGSVKSRTANYFASIAVLVLISALAACSHFQGGSATEAARGNVWIIARTPARKHHPHGSARSSRRRSRSRRHRFVHRQPVSDDPQAIEQGKQLYRKMNCAGCHAYTGKGNMGPDLTDTYWRYGGLPIQIYETIRDGRPQGMPAWGAALPPEEIWKLVAYIQSFGGTVAVADYEQRAAGGTGPDNRSLPRRRRCDAGTRAAKFYRSPTSSRPGESSEAKP